MIKQVSKQFWVEMLQIIQLCVTVNLMALGFINLLLQLHKLRLYINNNKLIISGSIQNFMDGRIGIND